MSDLPVPDLIGVAEAISILDRTPVTPRVVEVALGEALGLRLAADVVADRDVPAFDKAVMDGYAVRAADVAAGGVLTVIETAHAGATIGRGVARGTAIAIMTGASVPPGADAVVPVEQTTRVGDRVTFGIGARVGQAIARRGSDMVAGRTVLTKGSRMGPAQVAVAATVGAAVVSVFTWPVVAVLATGDEIVDADQVPEGPQIRNSNGPMLIALLTRLGCEVRDLGIVRDNPADLRSAIGEGLLADALFVAGGMSMGERDFVPGMLRDLGMNLAISKLRIKPGKPFVFATGVEPRIAAAAGEFDIAVRSRFAFGLPGNPVSAFVCTVRLAARVLNRMAGGPADRLLTTALLSSPLPANGPREFYQPATWDGRTVSPLPWKGSADLFTLATADALLIRPENAPAADAGEVVSIVRLDWF